MWGPPVTKYLRQSRPGATLHGFDNAYFAHCLTGAVGLSGTQSQTSNFMVTSARSLPTMMPLTMRLFSLRPFRTIRWEINSKM